MQFVITIMQFKIAQKKVPTRLIGTLYCVFRDKIYYICAWGVEASSSRLLFEPILAHLSKQFARMRRFFI